MKLDKISIKWKLFLYLTAFVAILLVVLWFFQIVFLDSFYKANKTRIIKTTAESIAENIDSDDLESLIESVSRQDDITVFITDTAGNSLYSSRVFLDFSTQWLSSDKIAQYYQKALDNGGSYFELYKDTGLPDIDNTDLQENQGDFEPDNVLAGRKPLKDFIPPDSQKHVQSMIYTKIAQKSDGSSVIIFLNASISPVNATVETLRSQLVYLTLLLLILSVLLSFFISKKISKPIIKINDSAKELAKGKFDTPFEGKGYREISELNDTLNYTAGELSKVEDLRRELIANISHDLRTPLTMITGYSEVMRDLPGENTPENIQIIIDEATRLTGLVNDVLNLSKLQSGADKVHFEEFNLTKSIWDILKRYQKLTKQDGYTIRFLCDEDVCVNGDELRMSQVVYNLINNALTYTGEDKEVTVRQTVKGQQVKIEVADTGEGIPEDKLNLVWDRYYKIEKSHKRAAIGTGLGLSIAKAILELHGAEYGVTSEKGKGSVFWFVLKTT